MYHSARSVNVPNSLTLKICLVTLLSLVTERALERDQQLGTGLTIAFHVTTDESLVCRPQFTF